MTSICHVFFLQFQFRLPRLTPSHPLDLRGTHPSLCQNPHCQALWTSLYWTEWGPGIIQGCTSSDHIVWRYQCVSMQVLFHFLTRIVQIRNKYSLYNKFARSQLLLSKLFRDCCPFTEKFFSFSAGLSNPDENLVHKKCKYTPYYCLFFSFLFVRSVRVATISAFGTILERTPSKEVRWKMVSSRLFFLEKLLKESQQHKNFCHGSQSVTAIFKVTIGQLIWNVLIFHLPLECNGSIFPMRVGACLLFYTNYYSCTWII